MVCCLALFSWWPRNLATGCSGCVHSQDNKSLPSIVGQQNRGFRYWLCGLLVDGREPPQNFHSRDVAHGVAVTFDGLFAMLAFWTIGTPLDFGTAIFGYTLYNMFYILPTPPGQVGSNEVVGLLVFSGLLHLPRRCAANVRLLPSLRALLMANSLIFLSALGLNLQRHECASRRREGTGVAEEGIAEADGGSVTGSILNFIMVPDGLSS